MTKGANIINKILEIKTRNTVKMQFTNDIKDIATSIKKEFELEIDAQEFIAKFCNKFEKYILERICLRNKVYHVKRIWVIFQIIMHCIHI